MMRSVPCMIMRGGTSRGPFLRIGDIPAQEPARSNALLNLMGSGHVLQVDGIGGGDPLTSKVALIDRSSRPEADVDYLFAQVDVMERRVDFTPNCGNMLAAVGPYAIESGLVEAVDGVTMVRIFNVNTQRMIESRVPTPNGEVCYEGETRISGVPGQAAGIRLGFLDVVGAKTGRLLPTGNAIELIDGIEVTCLDAATPTIMLEAAALGWQGNEPPAEMDADRERLALLERIRREAGRRMGMGDVSQSVLPKPILLSPAQDESGTLCVRYFVPHRCHKALAVTGSIALAVAVSVPGTVTNRLAIAGGKLAPKQCLAMARFEHPSGYIDVDVEHRHDDPHDVIRASVWRTARKIMSGTLFYLSDTAA